MPARKLEINWKRLFVEGFAIVISILLAFAIDAWWQDRQEHRLDQIHLHGVLDELRSHRSLLRDAVDAHQNSVTVGQEMLALAASGASQETRPRMLNLLVQFLSFYRINAPFGALNTAMTSGAVARMTDQKLASGMANWPTAIEDLLEEQINGHAMLVDLLDLLAENTALNSLLQAKINAMTISGKVGAVEQDTVSFPNLSAEPDFSFAFNDQGFTNRILMQMVFARAALIEARVFSAQLDALIEQLAACTARETC